MNDGKIEVFTNVHRIVKDKLTNLGRYIWKKMFRGGR
jgi:hypothetical protein